MVIQKPQILKIKIIMSRKLTTEEFIDRARNIHKDRYNYDKVKYIDIYTKVEIYCNSCKEYFLSIS